MVIYLEHVSFPFVVPLLVGNKSCWFFQEYMKLLLEQVGERVESESEATTQS